MIPNLTSAIIGSAFLTATVVLGEFTIASLLLKRTLPTYIVLYQNQEPQGGMALALVVFLATALSAGALHRRHPPARAGPLVR